MVMVTDTADTDARTAWLEHVDARFAEATLYWDPYPIAVIDDVLPEEVYDAVAARLPSEALMREVGHGNTQNTARIGLREFAKLGPDHETAASDLDFCVDRIKRVAHELNRMQFREAAQRETDPLRRPFFDHHLPLDEIECEYMGSLNFTQRVGETFRLHPHLDGGHWFGGCILYWSDRKTPRGVPDSELHENMGLWTYTLEDTDEHYDPWLDHISRKANQGTLAPARYIAFRTNRLITFPSLPWAFHGNLMTPTVRRIFSQLASFLDAPTVKKLMPRVGADYLQYEDEFTALSERLA